MFQGQFFAIENFMVQTSPKNLREFSKWYEDFVGFLTFLHFYVFVMYLFVNDWFNKGLIRYGFPEHNGFCVP